MYLETATAKRNHPLCVPIAEPKALEFGLAAQDLMVTRLRSTGTSDDDAWPDYLEQPEPGKYFEFLELELYWSSLCFLPPYYRIVVEFI